MKIVLIGQAPGPDGDPKEPLKGGRSSTLIYLLSGCATEYQYEALYDRRNLLPEWPGYANGKGDKFPAKEAREAAKKLLPELRERKVVLLGDGVAKAFGFKKDTPNFIWIRKDGVWFALSPHPSGVNLWWNKPQNKIAAVRFFGSIMTGDR